MAQNLYNFIFKAFCRWVTCWSLSWCVLFHIIGQIKRQHWLFVFKDIYYIFFTLHSCQCKTVIHAHFKSWYTSTIENNFYYIFLWQEPKNWSAKFCRILVAWNWCMNLWHWTFYIQFVHSFLEPGNKNYFSIWTLLQFYAFKLMLRCSLLLNVPFKLSSQYITCCYLTDKYRSKWAAKIIPEKLF